MKKRKTAFGIFLAAAIAAGQLSTATAANAADVNAESEALPQESMEEMLDESRDYAPDQLIVTFENGTSDHKIENIAQDQDASCERIQKVSDQKVAQINIADEDSMEEAFQKFQSEDTVVAVQPNYRYTIQKDDNKPDPYLDEKNQSGLFQYQLKNTHAEAAWTMLEQAGHSKTRVAVIDTGVDPKHEDLQKNLIKDSKGGYIQTLSGKKIHSMDDSDEEDGHGTHTTGIIGATYHNGKGGSGVASGHSNDLVEVMTVGASEDGYGLYTLDIVAAINYAVSKGAKVISMSFGGPGRDRVEEECIKNAYYNKGVVFVSASGNEMSDSYSSPSDMKEVISVNASNIENQSSAYWSNYGLPKDITAPGNAILSTSPGDRYVTMSGTSMACPVAAGIVALVRDVNRPDGQTLTPAQIYNIICASTKQKDFRENTTAYGIIDAEAAVKAAQEASADIPATSLYMKERNLTLCVGDDYSLETLVRPAACLQPVSWTSSDERVVTVDQYGNLMAVSEGRATVTAQVGELTQACDITVNPGVMATSLTIEDRPKDDTWPVDSDLELSATLKPKTVTNKEIYWQSSNPSVAMVENGIVETKAAGKTTITAKTYDGRVKDSFVLKVKNRPEQIKISKKVKWLQVGDSFQFKAKLLDAKGSGDVMPLDIIWTSNRKLAKINQKTGLFTAKKPGTAYVWANAPDYELQAYQKVIIAQKNYKGADYGLKQSDKTKNSVTLKWTKIPIASGYQVQTAAKKDGTFKTIATVKKGSTVKYKVKTKKDAFYRVRAYYYKHGAKKASWFSYSKVIQAKVAQK